MSDTATDSGRSKKRLRTGSPASAVLQEDAEFWLDDGTIILEAQSVRFRIYRGILAEHSPVFADMLSFPQPEIGNVSSGAPPCPVVTLDDSPDDLRHLLRALFPKKHAPIIYAGPHRVAYEALSACVRLSHKYQVDYLLDQSLEYLEHYFPLDFDDWNQVSSGPPSWLPWQAIGIVNIARRVGWPTILQTALMVCCTLPIATLVNGFVTLDGVIEKLDNDDMIRCMKGKVVLMTEFTGAVLRTFAPGKVVSAGCTLSIEGACQSAIPLRLYCVMHEPGWIANEQPFCDAALVLRACQADGYPPCAKCYSRLEERLVHEQRVLWGNLPEILEVDAVS